VEGIAGIDPLRAVAEAERDYGRTPIALDGEAYDLVVAAVAHDDYRALDDARLRGLIAEGGTLADFKGMWRERAFDSSIDRWSL
jgi:UDP-N-acetyl-D-galactosamine dehydrogenase